MKYLSGAQRTISKAAVRYALLPTGKASITSNGIQFRGLFYGCDLGFQEHWFDSARVEGRDAISVSYDPRDGSSIYFKPSASSEPVECYLLDSNKITGKFSTEELEQMQQAEHQEREVYRSTEDFQNILTKDKIQEIVDKAEAAFPDHPGSAHKRVSDISANRKAELENQYQESIRKKEVPAEPETSSPASGKSRIQQLLEQVLDENY
jgi:hypothetical protein